MEWQPISTVPKDGTRVLLWLPDDNYEVVGFWMENRQCWGTASGGWGDDRYEADYPTHWATLPGSPHGHR